MIGSPPRQADWATGPESAARSGCASPYEIGNTGIFVNVGAALTGNRLAPGSDGVNGVNGSPGCVGISKTLPRCTPSRFRIGP